MKVIDCLGDMCPIPLLMLEKEIPNIKKGGTVMLITDHSCSLTSIKDFCRMHHFSFHDNEAIIGVWEITISNILSSV
ncbi:response regulator SirA [Lachnotalea glycerini]|uniref:Sulfurtransferase TusA family protein n=1 Tax=Lachnotalea glycerini TaxID=1763509 RepID=A0A371JCI3_9FIRM|nr:response regulator SirA [Lachnotalea glycerini]RDY30469.1 sulfurtransferase TusA family protein [Lachnotalea glycerini]